MMGTMITLKKLLKPDADLRVFTLPFFLLLFLTLVSPRSFAVDIQVSVDRNPVSIDESFQIIFTATESPDDDPDFSPLEQDFSILNQSTSTSSSWVNGQSSKTVKWIVNVMAKQRGSLVIPAIKFGKDVSGVSTVLIIEKGKSADTGITPDKDLYIEVEATPQDPYIQSQVLYTMRLYTKIDIAQARLNEPELADAVIEKLGDDSSFNTQVNGVNYSVTERKYVIFPQKSGQLTIKPLVLTAEIIASNQPGFNSFFNSQMSKTKQVESKAIVLEVKPVPSSFTGKHWLAAEQLVLKQEWSSDTQQLKVGEPMTRTLSLVAKGTTVGQLPELNASIADDQLKVYPDQPVLKEQKTVDGLMALREEKIAFIPSKAGDYSLPAIEIPWFNTKTQAMEMARIPETKLTAVAGTIQSEVITPIPSAKISELPQQVDKAPAIKSEPGSNVWLWTSVFLAVGWLMTVIWFLTKRIGKKPVIEDNEVEINLKACIKTLKYACTNNDALAAKDALLEWGRQKFDCSNLNAIAVLCDARLRDEIVYLNQTLYGQESTQWDGKKLFQAFVENKAREKIVLKEDDSLEPLFRL